MDFGVLIMLLGGGIIVLDGFMKRSYYTVGVGVAVMGFALLGVGLRT